MRHIPIGVSKLGGDAVRCALRPSLGDGLSSSLVIGDNHLFNPSIATRHKAMQTARATMETYTAADRLRGALSYPGTTFPFVEVGQAFWFHRDRQGWLRGTVHSLDGKTAYVRQNGR